MTLSTALLCLLSIISVIYAVIEYFNNEQKTKSFVFFAIGFAGFLIATYRFSDYVDTQHLGNHEIFGQFGDYIGGVLNPIFGFMTVFLLIRSLSHESEQAKQDREDIKEANHLKKLERLSDALARATNSINSKLYDPRRYGKTENIANDAQSFMEYYINHTDKKMLNLRCQQLFDVGSAIRANIVRGGVIESEEIAVKTGAPEYNVVSIIDLLILIDHICSCYRRLIEQEKSGILKYQRCNDFIGFLVDMSAKILVTKERFRWEEEWVTDIKTTFDKEAL